MCLCLLKPIVFQNRPEEFGLAFDELDVHVHRTLVHIHIRIEDRTFLEINSALPIMNKLKKEKLN